MHFVTCSPMSSKRTRDSGEASATASSNTSKKAKFYCHVKELWKVVIFLLTSIDLKVGQSAYIWGKKTTGCQLINYLFGSTRNYNINKLIKLI